jgi:hypothetical protein
MKPTKIADGVYEVGVIDWNIRDFHGYSTDRGTSYNAYLVMDDERVALIDTVKAPFADQLIANISQVIDPQKIDVVVSNHTEMDHSGALPRIMHRVGEDKPLYCSKMGARNLASHFPNPWNYHPVKEGEDAQSGQAHPHLHGNPHDPLAGQHVHLPERGPHPLFQRRVRPALRGIRKIRRPGRPISWSRPKNTTPTS